MQEATTRWEREVKARVDDERDSRLARLDHLTMRLSQLEQCTLRIGESAERGHRMRHMWVLLRAVRDAIDSADAATVDVTPWLNELKDVSGPQDAVLVRGVLDDALSQPRVPGLASLMQRFERMDAALWRSQFLYDAPGPFSIVLSRAASCLMFRKEPAPDVPGNDVASVLARARWFLLKQDIDSAAREVNQLGGPVLQDIASDWLQMARRYLEVRQSLAVIETHLECCDLGLV